MSDRPPSPKKPGRSPLLPKTEESSPVARSKVERILALLNEHYPDADCSLHHVDPFQLLTATILSAQCTDERVNMVTPALFARYPDARAMAEASVEDIEAIIRSTGFYHNKARNIKACSSILVDRFGSEVPADLEILVALPGIGRKTANVILGNAYKIPGIVVDTHVGRISRRLGLTHHKDPAKVEQDLMKLIPPERWVLFSHQLILHGRRICQARKPKTSECPLEPYCDYARSRPH